MHTKKPLIVSIVIPVFNGSNYLGAAIDSALAQTYANIEVVVVNDGSTDDGATEKIARSYGDKISYYTKENGGVATALNYGIKKMKGDYFSWLSHDDLYEPNKVAEQVAYLKQSGDDHTIVACNASVLYASGVKKKTYIDAETFKYIDIFLSTSASVGLNGCALLIPRAALIHSGGFDKNLPVTQDYDLWFRLVKQGYSFHLLEKHLIISRRHAGQDSVQKQLLCYRSAEALHYGFLNQIPYERFEKMFIDSPVAYANFIKNYETYKAGTYRKTSSMMLKYILRFRSSQTRITEQELFHSEIGNIVSGTLDKKKKPRVIFYSNVWHRGGIERVLTFIFNHFSSSYDIILITNEDGGGDNQGYEFPRSILHLKIPNHNQLAELVSAVEVLEADVFVGNPNYSSEFIDIYEALREMKVRTIAYNHGHYMLPYTTGQYLYRTAVKLKESYAAADEVVWLSKIACKLYAMRNHNGVYIPNPVEIRRAASPKRHAEKKILAVGRFDDEVKQIDKMLLVFKEIVSIDPSYTLTIVGHCPMDMELPSQQHIKLSEFVKHNKIPLNNIEFLGISNDVSRFYEDAGFLLMTSRSEGFAMVLIEAMSHGVPCAAFNYLGIDEVVESGKNGWVRDQEEYSALAQDIVRTIGDRRAYSEMSACALQLAFRYRAEIFYEKWEILLKNLTTPGSSPTELQSLRIDEKLNSDESEWAITEYENALEAVIADYIDLSERGSRASLISKVKSVAHVLKKSIDEDGYLLTTERAMRKVYRKARATIGL